MFAKHPFSTIETKIVYGNHSASAVSLFRIHMLPIMWRKKDESIVRIIATALIVQSRHMQYNAQLSVTFRPRSTMHMASSFVQVLLASKLAVLPFTCLQTLAKTGSKSALQMVHDSRTYVSGSVVTAPAASAEPRKLWHTSLMPLTLWGWLDYALRSLDICNGLASVGPLHTQTWYA